MKWTYRLIGVTALIAAIWCYTAAPALGGMLLGVGILLEGVFWGRLLKRPRRT